MPPNTGAYVRLCVMLIEYTKSFDLNLFPHHLHNDYEMVGGEIYFKSDTHKHMC